MKKLILTIIMILSFSSMCFAQEPNLIRLGDTTIKENNYTVFLVDNFTVNKDKYAYFTLFFSDVKNQIVLAMHFTGDLVDETFILIKTRVYKNGKLIYQEDHEQKIYKVDNFYMQKAFKIMNEFAYD